MKRNIAAYLLLIVCLLAGVVYTYDLAAHYTIARGTAADGHYLVRYALAGGLLVLLAAACFGICRGKKVLHIGKPAGIFMAIAGLLWANTAGIRAVSLLNEFEWGGAGSCLCCAVTALWLVYSGLYVVMNSDGMVPVLFGMAGCSTFFVQLIYGMAVKPAALAYLNFNFRMLAFLAALLFATAWLRVICLPGTLPCTLLAISGLAAFLFGTCFLLPQTLLVAFGPGMELWQISANCAPAFLGLAGAACTLDAMR